MSDDRVIQLIASSFVPVAVNLYKIRDSADEGGDFFRLAQKQKSQYQGLWLLAPDGSVLAQSTEGEPDWTKKVLAALQSGLERFGAVKPRHARPTNPLPFRGLGFRPNGGVALAVSDRLIVVEQLRPDLPPGAIPTPLVDEVSLSASEWLEIAPRDARAGSEWVISHAVGRQLFRLLNAYDGKFRDPEEVVDSELVGRVASVRDGVALLSYRGRLAGTHPGAKYEGKEGQEFCSSVLMAGGVATYDIRAGQILSLKWVWDGLYRNFHEPQDHERVKSGRFGSVVEWRRGDSKAAYLDETDRVPKADMEPFDSTPEDALRTFLLALAARDEATLRAVTLPAEDFNELLSRPPETPGQLAILKANLGRQPIRRLTAGYPVKMPDGELRVIKPDDVREGRVVLWLDGEPLPARVESVGGHWKVFAAPFIAARKSTKAEVSEPPRKRLQRSNAPAR